MEEEVVVVVACNHIQADREAATTSNAVAVADRVDVCRVEDRAICSNHSRSPTTSRRLLGSKPIGNNCRTIGLHRQPAV